MLGDEYGNCIQELQKMFSCEIREVLIFAEPTHLKYILVRSDIISDMMIKVKTFLWIILN